MKRREFIQSTGKAALLAGAGMTLLSDQKSVRGTPANDKIGVAVVGCGGRGRMLLDTLMARSDVNIIACCDPQQRRAADTCKQARAKNYQPRQVEDFRSLLEDKTIDAFVNATPDHWHALTTILACQAGKDVYSEKPASHSAWEGKKMVEAARKYRRIVQHGTQSRSAAYIFGAKKYIEEGKLGKIHFVRVHNMKQLDNFPLEPPCPVPEGINWDLWSGPAPLRDYSPTLISKWLRFWDYSSGDIIYDGIHQLDLGRWLAGKKYPKSVFCNGGLYGEPGAAETPDTQVANFEFDDMLLSFELTLFTPYMLKIDKEVREGDMFPYWMQCTTRTEIYGDKGLMMVGRLGGGWEVYVRPKTRRPVVIASQFGRYPEADHVANFLECIRTRAVPNSEIEEGYCSTLLSQLATISYRLGGKKIDVNPADGSIIGCPEAEPFYKRNYRTPYQVPEEI